MNIICDIDGVVCDLHTQWLSLYNFEYNDNLESKSVTHWDLHKFVKPECGMKIYSYLENAHIYDMVKPVNGALEGIINLRLAGNKIIYATKISKGHAMRKKEWLEQWGFLDKSDQYVESENHDKGGLEADIMIDDYIKNFDGFLGKKILFSQPWNLSIEDGFNFRADSWEEVTDFIIGLNRFDRWKSETESYWK